MVQVDSYSRLLSEYGPTAAAVVLRVTAQLMKATTRDMDHVSRLQEDTFALLLPGAKLADAAAISERLRMVIERCRLPRSAGAMFFTVSIGVVEASEGDDMRRYTRAPCAPPCKWLSIKAAMSPALSMCKATSCRPPPVGSAGLKSGQWAVSGSPSAVAVGAFLELENPLLFSSLFTAICLLPAHNCPLPTVLPKNGLDPSGPMAYLPAHHCCTRLRAKAGTLSTGRATPKARKESVQHNKSHSQSCVGESAPGASLACLCGPPVAMLAWMLAKCWQLPGHGCRRMRGTRMCCRSPSNRSRNNNASFAPLGFVASGGLFFARWTGSRVGKCSATETVLPPGED